MTLKHDPFKSARSPYELASKSNEKTHYGFSYFRKPIPVGEAMEFGSGLLELSDDSFRGSVPEPDTDQVLDEMGMHRIKRRPHKPRDINDDSALGYMLRFSSDKRGGLTP